MAVTDLQQIANSLGLTELQEVATVGSDLRADNGLWRREWRIVGTTGELRGVCWRERNKERKAVRYVGKRQKREFDIYNRAYEGWRKEMRSLPIGQTVERVLRQV